MGEFIDVGAVFKAFVKDDVHHAQGEGGVGSGTDGDVPVSQRGGAGAVGVDDDEARAIAAGLLDHGPEMDVVAVDVRGPGEHQFGEAEILGGRAVFLAVYQVPGLTSGLGADGAVEAAGAQAVKETAVHGAEAEHADGAGVGQDGLGAVQIADLLEARGNGVEGFIPGDALEGLVLAAAFECTLGHALFSAQRVEDAVGRVDAVEVLGDFSAQKALGDGLRGVALDLDGAAGFVHRDENRTGIGAVVGADGVDDAERPHAVIVS